MRDRPAKPAANAIANAPGQMPAMPAHCAPSPPSADRRENPPIDSKRVRFDSGQSDSQARKAPTAAQDSAGSCSHWAASSMPSAAQAVRQPADRLAWRIG